MQKRAHFDTYTRKGWPPISWLEPYFLAPKGKEWTFDTGNDNWGLSIEGVDGTGHLESYKTRVDIDLEMWGYPGLGVLLYYTKLGGGYRDRLSSKGDMSRLKEWVRTLQGDLRPIGLFIPFPVAWKAVKEFMETDGQLPKSIEWVANRDLPTNTFPDPNEAVAIND
jgi:hypothetical protein